VMITPNVSYKLAAVYLPDSTSGLVNRMGIQHDRSVAGWTVSAGHPTKIRRQKDRPLPPPVLTKTAFALCLHF
jgi:hypothetical protein